MIRSRPFLPALALAACGLSFGAAAQDASELVYRADALAHARALEAAYNRIEQHITADAGAATAGSWPNDLPPLTTGWVRDWTDRGIRARYCGDTLLVYVAGAGPMRGGTAQRSVQAAPRLYGPADTRGPALHWLRRSGTTGVEAHGGAGRTSVVLPACMTAALPTDRVALASTAGGVPDPWTDTWVSRRADIEWRACPSGHHVPGGQVASGQRWRVVRERTMSRHGRPIGAETVASQAMERDHCVADYTRHVCVPNASPPPVARARYFRVEADAAGATRHRQFVPSPVPSPDPCAALTTPPSVSTVETELHRASTCAAAAGSGYGGTARDRRLRRVTTFSWQTTPVTAHTPWVPDRSDCRRRTEKVESVLCPRPNNEAYAGSARRTRIKTSRRTRASWSVAPVVHTPSWSAWKWKDMTCSRRVTETSTVACPAGQTGQVIKARRRWKYLRKSSLTAATASPPAPTYGVWSAWTETSRNCVTPPPAPVASDDSGNSPSGDTAADDPGGDGGPAGGGGGTSVSDSEDGMDTPDHNGASENAGGDPDGDGGEGDGGGCFLTTAISGQRGEADDGPTLTALRHFRDHYMTASPEHREMVALYYRLAPVIVAAIPRGHEDWEWIGSEIDRAVSAFGAGDHAETLRIYSRAMRRLADRWLPPDMLREAEAVLEPS